MSKPMSIEELAEVLSPGQREFMADNLAFISDLVKSGKAHTSEHGLILEEGGAEAFERAGWVVFDSVSMDDMDDTPIFPLKQDGPIARSFGIPLPEDEPAPA